MKNIIIIGAGDLGKELVWLIEDINRLKPTYLILGYLDDTLEKNTYSFNGYRVLGRISQLEEINKKMPCCAVLAIRDEKGKRKIVEEHREFSDWETIIHPTAVIANTVKIGKGCIFFPHVTVSVNTYLGSFGLYYINSTICNDCWIGNYVSIMANVTVEEHAEIGNGVLLHAGTCIKPYDKFRRETE